MNNETEPTESFISWQGKISGPHSQKDIQQLLKVGKIHSLYKIQVHGEWILLRDHLADLEQKARNLAKSKAEMPPSPPPISPPVAVPDAIWMPDEDFPQELTSATHMESLPDGGVGRDGESKGLAITSFVLSCFFFVPFLNLLTWLMGLIFGHLAFSQAGAGSKSKAATLAWVGLWLSYVELGFFLVGLGYFLALEAPMKLAFFLLHWQMLGIALSALLGSGILMLAVKLASGALIRFPVCFVGALLPAAVNNFAALSLNPSELTSGKGIAMLGFVCLILFVGQMFFWARFIRLPNDRELGLTNAALASLLYTVIFIFIGIGYFALLAVATS